MGQKKKMNFKSTINYDNYYYFFVFLTGNVIFSNSILIGGKVVWKETIRSIELYHLFFYQTKP